MRRTIKKTVPLPARSPERTRARILDAAFAEFAAQGFAGARVDAIARRAHSNKRMLYHYFTDKEGLFRAVLKWKIATRGASVDSRATDFVSRLPLWFEQNCADKPWVRMLAWESLQSPDGPVAEEPLRRRLARQRLAQIRAEQAAGTLNPAVSPEYLQLAMVSLTMFPLAARQVTRLITGRLPRDPKFQREYAAFLKQLSAVFLPPAKSK
jgi:AcrR family transcriptional regulator